MGMESKLLTLIRQGDTLGVRTYLQTKTSEEAALEVMSSDYGVGRGSKPALHLAATLGHVDILKQFLALPVNPDTKDDAMNTPLHFAADLGHAQVAHLLMKAGASADAKNAFGTTPLTKATVEPWNTHSEQLGKSQIQKMMAGEAVECFSPTSRRRP